MMILAETLSLDLGSEAGERGVKNKILVEVDLFPVNKCLSLSPLFHFTGDKKSEDQQKNIR